MELGFLRKIQESDSIWSFYFTKPAALVYEAGDYLDVEIAFRGSELGGRRWLTISSSPHQPHIRFTLKVPPQPSKFKQVFLGLHEGRTIQVSPPIGTFHLPRRTDRKVLWIAGGVGITPYLSQSQFLIHKEQNRDIACLYYAKPNEHIYTDMLTTVSQLHVLSDRSRSPLELADDYKDREIYLSGPQNFCMDYFDEFLNRGLPRRQLHLDYFPGYSDI